jgi:hypothetical protein
MHNHKPLCGKGICLSAGRPQEPGTQLLQRRRPETNNDTMLSCRYELKYRIRESKARAVAQYVQSYIHPDKYALKQPGLAYSISSLYFDSNNLHLCKETIHQRKNRFKLRIRCYDDNPESPCFVEIKRRLNSVIMKDRARIQREMLKGIVNFHVPDELYSKDKKILSQFYFYLVSLRARPIVLVRYMRQAFEGDSSNRVRITFDRQLSFKAANRIEVTHNGSGWKLVPMDFVILEIKFTGRYPIWLSDMIKIFDLKQTAMSKYVSSVQTSCSLGLCEYDCGVGV